MDETEASSGDTLPQASSSETKELVKGLQFAYDVPSQDTTNEQDVGVIILSILCIISCISNKSLFAFPLSAETTAKREVKILIKHICCSKCIVLGCCWCG